MKVKLKKDYCPELASVHKGGVATDIIDVPRQTVELLLAADMIEEPDEKAIRDDLVVEEVRKQMDPLMKELQKLTGKAGKPEGDPPDEGDKKEEGKNGGWATKGHFLKAVSVACSGGPRDSRLSGKGNVGFELDEKGHLKALTAGHAGESEDPAGGFVVFPEFRNELMMLGLPGTTIRQRSFVIPMATETLKIPFVNDRDRSSTLWGGVQTYWLAETATITPSRAEYGQKELRAKDLCGLTFASMNLLQDNAIGLEAFLMQAFSGAIAWEEDKQFFVGTGVNKPHGFMNSPALFKQSRTTANLIDFDDIILMYSRMYPPSLGRGVWVAHPTCLPQLATMSQNSGTSAALVWLAPGGISSGGAAKTPPGSILGNPLVFSEHCKSLGTLGDLVFCDFSHYLIGDRQELLIDSSAHVAFETREIAWRFVHRVDGMVWLAGTITDAQSYETSPFVALDATTR